MLWLALLLSYDNAQPQPDWRVMQWPRDLAAIPCATWYKDGFGFYSLNGVIEYEPFDIQVRNPRFQPSSPEGRVIEEKCGPISRQLPSG
jgi:hypothetical protein